jgi:hypothetical protein
MRYPLKNRKRCRLHGGVAPQNKRNVGPSHAAIAAWNAFRRAQGLPPPQLKNLQPKPPRPTVKEMKMQAVEKIDWFEDEAKKQNLIPRDNAAVGVRPSSELTMPELLGEVGALAFAKLRTLLLKDREIRDGNPDSPTYGEIIKTMDIKVERFEADLAMGSAKLFARVAETSLRPSGNDKLQEILDAINKAELSGA